MRLLDRFAQLAGECILRTPASGRKATRDALTSFGAIGCNAKKQKAST
jgi:hypothetical protein